MNSLDDFILWLDSYVNLERERSGKNHALSLDAMYALCKEAGHPEQCAPVIHIAGSKGKGSTAKMTACILAASGMKAGLYLSPHVSDFRERVGSAEGFFTSGIYNEAATEVMAVEEKVRKAGVAASWFELVTLFAFVCFRIAHTDINVIEVGIGGRLDATNVVSPIVTCIMPIEAEHTAWLGNTITQIAGEKAGIIKHAVPVVVAPQPYASAMRVIRTRAAEMNAPLVEAIGAIHVKMPMAGEQMARNAKSAAIAAHLAHPSVTEKDVEIGLGNASLPGRFECFDYNGVHTIIDGAHTVSSIACLLDTLNSIEIVDATGGEDSLLFGCASDKDVEGMARLVMRHPWRRVMLTCPGALPRSDIARTEAAFKACMASDGCIKLRDKMPLYVETDCNKAIMQSLQGAYGGTLVAAGSFYLAAAVREIVVSD